MRVFVTVVVLSLLVCAVESFDAKRKSGTPEEMQEAQKARRMEGAFPDFNRQPGVNGFPPGFHPDGGMPPPPPGFNGQQGGPGMMDVHGMRNGPMNGMNGMPPPPPGFNGQQGGPPGMMDANGMRNGPMNGMNGMPPPPPGFNGQQGGPPGMMDANGMRNGPMNGMNGIPPPPPPGFNGQGFNGQGFPPGAVDANGLPLDPRLRAHEQMKQQIRQRSNAYLQRMDTMLHLSEDAKSTMRADIEELYKVEADLIDSRAKQMQEFDSLREVTDEKERNIKMETIRVNREQGHVLEDKNRQRLSELRQSIDQRMNDYSRGTPGGDP